MANKVKLFFYTFGGLLLLFILLGFINTDRNICISIAMYNIVFLFGLLLGVIASKLICRKPWILLLCPVLGIIIYVIF